MPQLIPVLVLSMTKEFIACVVLFFQLLYIISWLAGEHDQGGWAGDPFQQPQGPGLTCRQHIRHYWSRGNETFVGFVLFVKTLLLHITVWWLVYCWPFLNVSLRHLFIQQGEKEKVHIMSLFGGGGGQGNKLGLVMILDWLVHMLPCFFLFFLLKPCSLSSKCVIN